MTRATDLFACIAIVGFSLIIFGFLAFWRYLRHKEILALAEKGLVYPQRADGKGALRWGIVITAVGAALIIGLLPEALRGAWPLLLLGLLPAFFGLSLVLIYVLSRPDDKIAPEAGKSEEET